MKKQNRKTSKRRKSAPASTASAPPAAAPSEIFFFEDSDGSPIADLSAWRGTRKARRYTLEEAMAKFNRTEAELRSIYHFAKGFLAEAGNIRSSAPALDDNLPMPLPISPYAEHAMHIWLAMENLSVHWNSLCCLIPKNVTVDEVAEGKVDAAFREASSQLSCFAEMLALTANLDERTYRSEMRELLKTSDFRSTLTLHEFVQADRNADRSRAARKAVRS